MKEQGLFHHAGAPEPAFTDTLELDLGTVEPSIAGPRRPQDRIPLAQAKEGFGAALPSSAAARRGGWRGSGARPGGERLRMPDRRRDAPARARLGGDRRHHQLHQHLQPVGHDGRGAAGEEGGGARAGPQAVGEDLAGARFAGGDRLLRAGRARPPPWKPSASISSATAAPPASATRGRCRRGIRRRSAKGELVVASVLSGNRNFEGRINSEVRANYLMSPPLVVAFALAGRIDIDLVQRAARHRRRRAPGVPPGHLADARRRSSRRSREAHRVGRCTTAATAGSSRATSAGRPCRWQESDRFPGTRTPPTCASRPTSRGCRRRRRRRAVEIRGARAIALLGDSVTTDHISPAGSIKKDSPAGEYLRRAGRGAAGLQLLRLPARQPRGDGARHLRQRAHPQPAGAGDGGGLHHATCRRRDHDDLTTRRCATSRTARRWWCSPGKEYGSGSSRDWAAKGPYLQGIKAVIAESYERIHRSNLIGMGILPLQFRSGDCIESLRPHRRGELRRRGPGGVPRRAASPTAAR